MRRVLINQSIARMSPSFPGASAMMHQQKWRSGDPVSHHLWDCQKLDLGTVGAFFRVNQDLAGLDMLESSMSELKVA